MLAVKTSVVETMEESEVARNVQCPLQHCSQQPERVHQRREDTQNTVPPSMGASLSHKKGRSPDTCTTWMDPENTTHSERSRHRRTHRV